MDTVSEDSFLQNNMKVLKTADAVLFVYDQSNNATLQHLADYWLKEVNRFSKPNCVKAILSNKSDYFLKTYDKESIELCPVDSDDEEEASADFNSNLEDQMRADIGKCVVDQESKFFDEDDDDEDDPFDKKKTMALTDQIQSKYGVKVFETSALLGTGIMDAFNYITDEMLS